MILRSASHRWLLAFALCAAAPAQIPLNQTPSRVVGHAQLRPVTASPNLVEGRELNGPQGVAVDPRANVVYVADTGNHRVLGWLSASAFANGAPADFVVGQRDKLSTLAQGPGTTFTSGLTFPTSVGVDSDGNLYVADSGNNRIVRYTQPSTLPPGEARLASFVIGQPSLNSRTGNFNGVTDRSLLLATGQGAFRTAMTFDPNGNLWFTDAGNNRVLRYPAAALSPGAPLGPSANLVLGQPDFTTNQGLGISNEIRVRTTKSGLREPSSIALDQTGRLFVTDRLARVLVYAPPFTSGMDATRLMGIVQATPGAPPLPGINEYTTGIITSSGPVPAEGVFTIGNIPFVVDTPSHRILRFDPFDLWTPESTLYSPAARAVIAQDTNQQTQPTPNRGLAEPTANTFFGPVAGTFANNETFIVDSSNNRITVHGNLSSGPPLAANAPYNATRVLGQISFEFRSPNLIEGREFFFAAGGTAGGAVVIDSRTTPPRLYVVDTFNNRVLGFADARKVKPGDRADIVIGQPDFVRAHANFPSNSATARNDAGLFLPSAAAVDSQGNLWVTDQGNSRVLRFPQPFAYQGPLPMRANLVLGQADFNTAITDATPRTMAQPSGIAFTAAGAALVSDAGHHRVLFFTPPFSNGMAASNVFGQPDFETVTPGNAANKFNVPRQISTDTDDRLYVTDSSNNRIQIFSRAPGAGTDPRAAFTLGPTSGLRLPASVTVSPNNGEIWVADAGNNRSVRFPRFDVLVTQGDQRDYLIPGSGAPIAVAIDGFGNLFVGDTLNRVAIYYPGVFAQNGANYLTRVAPGTIATLSCRNLNYSFTDKTVVFNEVPNPVPLPRELGELQVLVNDQPVGLYFISPFQINFLMPNDAPSNGTVEVLVTEPGVGRIIASANVAMDVASPAFFTAGSTGTGQIAALNQDGSVNSSTNPALRGQVIQLFATGAGFIPNAPPDGAPADGPTPTETKPRVVVGTRIVEGADILYSGLAPGLIGVWQINVKIPEVTAPSNAVQVIAVMRDIPSNNPSNPNQIRTTIAVR